MPNYLMKCLSCRVILLYVILMIAIGAYPAKDNQGTKKLYVAKRNFLSRERDYLRTKPLSNDLRSFIKRIKRTSGFPGRRKRDDDIKDHMFVVNNGNIVPLENMNDVTANVPSSDPSGLGNFTVIPLIIPITVKTFTNATFCDNITEYNDEASTESFGKSEEKFYKDVQTEKSVKPTPPSSNSTKEVTTDNSSTTAEIVADDDSSRTKSENMKFLNKVLSDVQELISYEKEGKHTGTNEGAMCSVIGDWDSKAGGMQLQITSNESLHGPMVQVVDQEPEAQSGFLLKDKWNVTLQMPFKHSSLIVLTAISDKSVASFIGDCRICEGSETIAGNWMLAIRSLNCKDRQDAHSFFSDVMSKNNVRRLQKAHLEEMSTRTTTTEL